MPIPQLPWSIYDSAPVSKLGPLYVCTITDLVLVDGEVYWSGGHNQEECYSCVCHNEVAHEFTDVVACSFWMQPRSDDDLDPQWADVDDARECMSDYRDLGRQGRQY